MSNVFRVIAQQLRGRRSLYGHVMVEARDAFRLIDKNGDGEVDIREFLDVALSEEMDNRLRQHDWRKRRHLIPDFSTFSLLVRAY